MYNVEHQHVHFVGIGGVGMAGIAEVLLNLGYAVSGSDLKESALTQHLQAMGARIATGHRAENIPPETTTVVLSSAVQPENVELQAARRLGVPCIARAEMLAELMRMKYGIAVAGSHGKTTTTSMTAKLLRDAGFDPTVIIGGRVLSETSGARLGTGQYLVAEADESDGSFCFLRPAIAIVTNIDAEHMAHYGSFGALEEAFFSFLSTLPFYGVAVVCGDDPVVSRLASRLERRVVRYGLSPENSISASDIVVNRLSTTFCVHCRGRSVGPVTLPLPGAHMVSNALAAIAVALELGADLEQACASLAGFAGVARRSQLIADVEGVVVLDDYAHHPREISSTLTALRSGWFSPAQSPAAGRSASGRLIAMFQPHRYSRTKELFHEFLTCFDAADQVIVGDIYPAGEAEIPGISGEALAAAMQHPNVAFSPILSDCLPALLEQLAPGDVVITVGAGSVGNLSYQIRDRLIARQSSSVAADPVGSKVQVA